MLLATPTVFAKPSHSALLALATQELSPTKIRQSIADLVGQNRMDEAETLSSEALKRFPKSEDILIIRALVCQIRQDWRSASTALENLIDLQGHATPSATWGQWVRVLRCNGDDDRAERSRQKTRRARADCGSKASAEPARKIDQCANGDDSDDFLKRRHATPPAGR